MIIDFCNRKPRIIKTIFNRTFGFLFLSVILISIISYASYFYDSDKSNIVIILNSIFLILLWSLYYYTFYRFIFQYYFFNKNQVLRIDTSNLTIQSSKNNGQSFSEEQYIDNIILHIHKRSKPLHPKPKNLVDKVENFTYSNYSNNGKFRNIWYLEITTDDSNTFIVTSLMIKQNEIPFKDITIRYNANPILKQYSKD